MADLVTARVTASHGRHFFVTDPLGNILEAVRRGKKGDVVVGDLVRCRPSARGQCAIESIEKRTSLLFRSDEWRTKELAANIDLVAIVYASRPTPNPWFVWKAILAAHQAGIRAAVIRNKTDLSEGAEAAAALARELESLGTETLSLSAQADPGAALDKLRTLTEGHRTLLVGQSGMGKSTILNLLVPEAAQKTQEFSLALDLGKQTTTVTRWFETASGAIVDSPGFQEFGLAHMTLGDIMRAMPDIAEHVGACRFANCRHLDEPGCGVKAALAAGLISQARYEFYCAVARETLRKPSWQ